MAFKMNLPKAAVLGVMLLLCLDVIHCFPITGTPGVGIQDFTNDAITVRCSSGDDNMGTRMMRPKDVWSWTFKPNVSGTTLFWCDFSWNSQRACFIVWDIDTAPLYDSSVNDWRVTPTGFTLYDPVKSVWNIRHNWGVACTGKDANTETESTLTDVGDTN